MTPEDRIEPHDERASPHDGGTHYRTEDTADYRSREHVGGQRTITELLRQLARDATTLVKDEVELVRAETQAAIERARHSVTQFVSAGIFFLIGGLALVASLIIGLAEFMEEWLAALIVGIASLLIGLGLRSRASSNLSPEKLKPRRTSASLRRDREMLKEKLS